MTNDEKRDRKLRETFEQCLSGIDTLPSQRAEITKKLSEAPAHTGRIAFRAIALPAALTLLLCAALLTALLPMSAMAAKRKKKEEEAPKTTKICPYCKSEINIEATRCPHCTSEQPKEA